MKKSFLIIIILFFLLSPTIFGQVGIGTSEPDPSAILDLQSTARGLLLPRLTTSQIFYINNPSAGLIAYNTDSLDIWIFNGELWIGLIDHTDSLILTNWICGIDIFYEEQYYKTVKIGTQCWMAENLNVGTRINGSQNQTQQLPEIIEKYCYNDTEDSCDIYGGLYQWDEMMQYTNQEGIQGICPPGWQIPTDADYCILTTFIDATVNCNSTGWIGTDVGTKMKSTSGWNAGGNGTNTSGFTAFPGGYRSPPDQFSNLGIECAFWTSTGFIETSPYAWLWVLLYSNDAIGRSNNGVALGLSVRCLKD